MDPVGDGLCQPLSLIRCKEETGLGFFWVISPARGQVTTKEDYVERKTGSSLLCVTQSNPGHLGTGAGYV